MLLPTLVLEFGGSLSTSPAAFGLCITYALDLSAFLKFGTKMTLDIQRGMAGVERILEYADNTPNEPTGGMPVPSKSWPTAGRVVMSELCVRYPNRYPSYPNPNPNPNPDQVRALPAGTAARAARRKLRHRAALQGGHRRAHGLGQDHLRLRALATGRADARRGRRGRRRHRDRRRRPLAAAG